MKQDKDPNRYYVGMKLGDNLKIVKALPMEDGSRIKRYTVQCRCGGTNTVYSSNFIYYIENNSYCRSCAAKLRHKGKV